MNCVYSCTDIFYIVTYIDRSGLYCASKNLFTTFSIITPYCVIAGIHMHTSYNHQSVIIPINMHKHALDAGISFAPKNIKKITVSL